MAEAIALAWQNPPLRASVSASDDSGFSCGLIAAIGTIGDNDLDLTVGCTHSLDATDVLPLSSLG